MAPLQRLRDDRGIALVMALGIMLVLAIALATIIGFSGANQSSARYSRAEQDAFSLAEAGLNNAYAVLAKAAENDPDGSRIKALDDATLGPLLPSQTTSYPNGSVTWYGSFDGDRTWTLTATGVVPDPVGEGTDARRTVSTKVQVAPASTQSGAPPAWNYVYIRGTGASCELNVEQTIMGARLYVPGNICLDNGGDITAEQVHTTGRIYVNHSQSSVGEPGTPIMELQATQGCQYRNRAPVYPPAPLTDPVCANGPQPAGDNVWAAVRGSSPPAVSAPTADFVGAYQYASPGPNYHCTSGYPMPAESVFDPDTTRDNDAGTFELAPPNSSYQCATGTGEMSWNHTTRKLKINGMVYLDGHAFIDGNGFSSGNKTIEYQGHGTLFLSGTFYLDNQIKVCAVLDGDDCDEDWDPSTEMLVILADGNGNPPTVPPGTGIFLGNSTEFQGALYATEKVEMINSVDMQGPIIGDTLVNGNSAETIGFPMLIAVPFGLPGVTVTTWTLGRPEQFRELPNP